MDNEFKMNLDGDTVHVTYINGKEQCPLLYRIKEGYKRYGVSGASNDQGDKIIYFQFGVGKESAKKEDGSWISSEELADSPVNWLAGFELNSVHETEVLSDMFREAAELLIKIKEKEKENESAI